MKFVIFGSSGMLGTYLKKYFSERGATFCHTRKDIDLNDDAENIIKALEKHVGSDDIIINAAGVIHQRNPQPEEMVNVNGAFPFILQNLKEQKGCEVFHITTDCVFSGIKNEHEDGLLSYNEKSYHDASDLYGRTKSLGEAPDLTTVRTSIIGEELHNKLSLLEWAKSKRGQTISGYVNHLWNGITCHELCILIDRLIQDKFFWTGVRHFHSPEYVNKYTLLKNISNVYDLDLNILPTTENKCSRILTSIYSDFSITKSIDQQLRELKTVEL